MSVRIPYAESNGYLTAEVTLRHAADVFLVDYSNYQKYKSGQSFKYHGGYYNRSPVRISVEGAGRWYLIVRGSDYQYTFY